MKTYNIGEIKMDNEKATKLIEQPHSVKIAISQKLKWSCEVKCYAETLEEAKLKALKTAKELEVLIKEKNGV